MKRRILLHYFTHPGLNQREEIQIYNYCSQPLCSPFYAVKTLITNFESQSVYFNWENCENVSNLTKLVQVVATLHVLIKSLKTNGSGDPIMQPW